MKSLFLPRQRHQGELLKQAPQLDCSSQGRKEAAPAGKVSDYGTSMGGVGLLFDKDCTEELTSHLRTPGQSLSFLSSSFNRHSFKHCEEVDLSRHSVENMGLALSEETQNSDCDRWSFSRSAFETSTWMEGTRNRIAAELSSVVRSATKEKTPVRPQVGT
eukprot:SM000273S10253  [mRNA]  locus=s273:19038:28465:- [translate_table: standard]